MSVQWVNTDNSLPGANTLIVNGLLILTDDPTAFTNQHDPAILASLTLFLFEPLSPVQHPQAFVS